jgi:hypothetical protein
LARSKKAAVRQYQAGGKVISRQQGLSGSQFEVGKWLSKGVKEAPRGRALVIRHAIRSCQVAPVKLIYKISTSGLG